MKTTRNLRGSRRSGPPLPGALRGSALLALVSAALLLLASCGDPPPLPLCGQIPDGGCPIGRGGSCTDDTCAALYDCVDSKWTQVERCEGGAGGGGGGASSGGAGPGGGPCTPVTLDHSGDKSGCTPDLENPDCPAAAAESCAETACLTGCLDFFLCTKDGWVDVAHCDDQGVLTITQ